MRRVPRQVKDIEISLVPRCDFLHKSIGSMPRCIIQYNNGWSSDFSSKIINTFTDKVTLYISSSTVSMQGFVYWIK